MLATLVLTIDVPSVLTGFVAGVLSLSVIVALVAAVTQ